MVEPFWIIKGDAIAIHDRQLAEHGGPPGLRDEGLLESALARPENLSAYGDPDLADLAAAYAFGIARNHPFIDGNKRTSFGVCLVFLDLNGFDLPADDDANIATWLALAAGTVSEVELAAWLRARIVPLD
ncbi:type II toxin-antitoxin system death-on-curing family toxin [Lichenifustis flavocetrariae]|uniref:Type II toxin-antitoxin system death-on-curing family toxin n=1 Tax=Lichenifustis flavocetrariae TaxID=2949735 RepID=A0AA42CRL4_9HYPH|nr:type II toxin-antitoxin system death-on-curing family toxin [Lichenifustis flavocetrariae]MCW6512617.1 type II toxin-antitoxin system death-on-curing family toxin [Lichenifustis flavocetrariae]